MNLIARTLLLSGVGYIGPGDIVPGAASWHGLRAYNKAYARANGPAIDVVKASDGTLTKTINVLRDGSLDVATIASLGYAVAVTKAWDQTGNGHHVTQATLSAMPTLTLRGVGIRPTMDFASASSQVLNDVGTTPLGSQPLSVATTAYGATSATSGRLWRNGNVFIIHTSGGNQLSLVTNQTMTVACTDNTWFGGAFILNDTSSIMRINTTESTGGAGTGTPGTAASALGGNASGFWNGKIQEFGLWGGSFSFSAIQRSTLNSNSKAYWGY